MSIDFAEQQALVESLESALDFKRVVSVFDQLLGILRSQQEKIDALTAEQTQLRIDLESRPLPIEVETVEEVKEKHQEIEKAPVIAAIPDDLLKRVSAAEARLEEVYEIVVGGTGDDSILREDPLTPYLMFTHAPSMVNETTLASIDEASEAADIESRNEKEKQREKDLETERAKLEDEKREFEKERQRLKKEAEEREEQEHKREQEQERKRKEAEEKEREEQERRKEQELAHQKELELGFAEGSPLVVALGVNDGSPRGVSPEDSTLAEESPLDSALGFNEDSAPHSKHPTRPSSHGLSRDFRPHSPQRSTSERDRPQSHKSVQAEEEKRNSVDASTAMSARPTPLSSARGKERDRERRTDRDVERDRERDRERDSKRDPHRDAERDQRRDKERDRERDLRHDRERDAQRSHAKEDEDDEPPVATRRFVSSRADRLATSPHASHPAIDTSTATDTNTLSELGERTKSNFRRKMNIDNLPFLTLTRRRRILFLLRMRGTFLLQSKALLDKAKKKYAGESLKQRIDCLEADLQKMQLKYSRLQDTVKKNNLAIKDSFPRNFQELWGKFDVLFGYLEKFGGLLGFAEKLEMLNSANPEIFQRDFLEERVRAFVKKELVHPVEEALLRESSRLRERIADVHSDMFTKTDVNSMLKHSANEQNTDPNHAKLMQLINKMQETFYERVETTQENKRKLTTIAMGSSTNAKDLEKLEFSMQKYADERIQELSDEINKMHRMSTLKSSQNDEELVLLREKIHFLELAKDANLVEKEKLDRERKEEMEALMILQRRIANLSVDRVMDELRDVQRELGERPNAQQLEEMLKGVESTFHTHLGENVFGLKGLVQQVYRQIQNKVDRDDIKRLISARLGQMEKEIVHREEEMLQLASSTRCLSCGHMPRPASAKKKKDKDKEREQGRRSPSPIAERESLTSAPAGEMLRLDDNLDDDNVDVSRARSHSAPPEHPHNVVFDDEGNAKTTNNPYSSEHSEQLYALLTGQVGLKPIQLRSTPLQSNKPNQQSVSLKTEKIPEPLYRKARMSQQIRDMVKVQSPALEQYGYHPAKNPLYVLDGQVLEDNGSTSTFVTGQPGNGGNSSSYFNNSVNPLNAAGRNAVRSGRVGNGVAAKGSDTLSNVGRRALRSAGGDGSVVLPDIDMKYSASTPQLPPHQ